MTLASGTGEAMAIKWIRSLTKSTTAMVVGGLNVSHFQHLGACSGDLMWMRSVQNAVVRTLARVQVLAT